MDDLYKHEWNVQTLNSKHVWYCDMTPESRDSEVGANVHCQPTTSLRTFPWQRVHKQTIATDTRVEPLKEVISARFAVSYKKGFDSRIQVSRNSYVKGEELVSKEMN
jgi:hypothetical protein